MPDSNIAADLEKVKGPPRTRAQGWVLPVLRCERVAWEEPHQELIAVTRGKGWPEGGLPWPEVCLLSPLPWGAGVVDGVLWGAWLSCATGICGGRGCAAPPGAAGRDVSCTLCPPPAG